MTPNYWEIQQLQSLIIAKGRESSHFAVKELVSRFQVSRVQQGKDLVWQIYPLVKAVKSL